MTLNSNQKQKSPKRRFLLILGLIIFPCIIILGFMIMFWDGLNLALTQTQRYIFGALFVLYGILRLPRTIKSSRTDDE
ncbi:hypothetical protein EOD41_07710 [Mucilaginibacter limnophilus]|uniref:Uncharacterized protein n=1 Tax=Mucilaginibacter limnophilus TaxID=1932778 RepID=A0A437MW01_9SPHI|nr:hypothetical protein EOD41_07710 [Mucilaginibacter limnophilus]